MKDTTNLKTLATSEFSGGGQKLTHTIITV